MRNMEYLGSPLPMLRNHRIIVMDSRKIGLVTQIRYKIIVRKQFRNPIPLCVTGKVKKYEFLATIPMVFRLTLRYDLIVESDFSCVTLILFDFVFTSAIFRCTIAVEFKRVRFKWNVCLFGVLSGRLFGNASLVCRRLVPMDVFHGA